METQTKVQVIVIPADDKPLRVEEVDNDFRAMQKLVGGYIERVSIVNVLERSRYEDVVLICNEEGILHGLPQNTRASLLYGYTEHGNAIFGDAFIIGEWTNKVELCKEFTNVPEVKSTKYWNKLFRDIKRQYGLK